MYSKSIIAFVLVIVNLSVFAQQRKLDVNKQLDYCKQQASKILNEIPQDGQLPRMIVGDAKTWKMVPASDWTSGFFPGILWYLFEYTKDTKWKTEADKYTSYLLPLSKKPAFDHDLGFQIFCSYGNAYRLTGEERYRTVINQTADTLATLFNPKIGTILSWPFRVKELGGHNTIIDNMINLELLMWSGKNRRDTRLQRIAEKHAEVTMRNHFRPDYTSYHVVVYNENGKAQKHITYQGEADESMWARGQAWAIYGYTMMYRESKNKKFLDFAQRVANIYLKKLPPDYIPYWDFNAPLIPNDTRDASAAAITASALIELSTFTKGKASQRYKTSAEKMLLALSTDKYQSRDKNSAFLMHSRGSKTNEIDISINYADYYYLEALIRWKLLAAKKLN